MTYSILQVDHANGYREWALRRSDGKLCVFEEASEQDVQDTLSEILAGIEDPEDYF